MRGLTLGEGNVVETLEYPFMAGVTARELRPRFPRAWPTTHTFGATLIHPQWLLSSAHGSRERAVRLNTQALRAPGGLILDVEEVFCHVNYDDLTQENDIALLRLGSPGAVGVTPVEFAKDPSWRGEAGSLFSVGWGRDGANGFDGLLRERLVTLFDQGTCRSMFAKSSGLVSESDFCTVSPMDAAGDGDSGGPILHRRADGRLVQVGVISESFLNPGLPDKCVDVAQYAPWISQVMQGNRNVSKPVPFGTASRAGRPG